MTAAEVLAELQKLGSAQTKKTWLRHGAQEPCFGVKIGDMKTLMKKTKRDHALALELWETGNADARYFASLICDPAAHTRKSLDHWAKTANWSMLSEYAVAWAAAESPHAVACAEAWIKAKAEGVAAAGWSTYASHLSITEDAGLDLPRLKALLAEIPGRIAKAGNRVKYTMNGFVIAAGGFSAALHQDAVAIAEKLGTVAVDVGDTDCKVPVATEYLAKIAAMGRVGKRKKTAYC